MDARLKLAVVGAGHLGKIHARLLAEMPDVELVAVADPVQAAREKVAADNHTEPVADYRRLLEIVDGAVIATPTACHHAVALDFLQHGKPLLIEKPLAATLTEAEELVEAAERAGTILQVGHIERFNPAFTAVASRLGRPRYVEAVRASGFTGRSTDIGVVYDLMIHDIDLLLNLVQSQPVSVSAIGVGVLGKHEDAVQARLEFADGSVANLSASRISNQPAPKRQMQLWSEDGFATIDFGNRTAQVICPSATVRAGEFDYNGLSPEEKAAFQGRLFSEILPVENLEIEPRNALADELRDFVDCIRTASTPRVTGQHGRNAIAVAEAILTSMQEHAWRPAAAETPAATPHILRGPHWQQTSQPRAPRRSA